MRLPARIAVYIAANTGLSLLCVNLTRAGVPEEFMEINHGGLAMLLLIWLTRWVPFSLRDSGGHPEGENAERG